VQRDGTGPLVERSGSSELLLKSFHESPSYCQSNPYILSGYRVDYSWEECFRSIFSWHNETMNIYTHLIPMLFFFFIINIYTFFIALDELEHRIIFFIYLASVEITLFCSTVFHIFYQQSESSSHFFLKIDMVGMMISFFSFTVCSLWYTWADRPDMRLSYMVITTAVCGIGLFLGIFVKFEAHNYFAKLLLMAAIFFVTLMPLAHDTSVTILYGAPHSMMYLYLRRMAVTVSLFILSGLLYLFKVPERFAPGMFDYIGCSHNIMHVIVAFNFVYHYNTLWAWMEAHKYQSFGYLNE